MYKRIAAAAYCEVITTNNNRGNFNAEDFSVTKDLSLKKSTPRTQSTGGMSRNTVAPAHPVNANRQQTVHGQMQRPQNPATQMRNVSGDGVPYQRNSDTKTVPIVQNNNRKTSGAQQVQQPVRSQNVQPVRTSVQTRNDGVKGQMMKTRVDAVDIKEQQKEQTKRFRHTSSMTQRNPVVLQFPT